jgi:hypothetical protein
VTAWVFTIRRLPCGRHRIDDVHLGDVPLGRRPSRRLKYTCSGLWMLAYYLCITCTSISFSGTMSMVVYYFKVFHSSRRASSNWMSSKRNVTLISSLIGDFVSCSRKPFCNRYCKTSNFRGHPFFRYFRSWRRTAKITCREYSLNGDCSPTQTFDREISCCER